MSGYQVMPRLSADEYADLEGLSNLPGFKKISDAEIEWFLTQYQHRQIAMTSIKNAMWREAHPKWRRRKSRTRDRVYFIVAPSVGLVKIGFSNSVASRFKSIQTMSPVPLTLLGSVPGGAELESKLHKSFAAHRHHGEWFTVCDEITDYIEEVLQ